MEEWSIFNMMVSGGLISTPLDLAPDMVGLTLWLGLPLIPSMKVRHSIPQKEPPLSLIMADSSDTIFQPKTH
jgi:hypothetical protein